MVVSEWRLLTRSTLRESEVYVSVNVLKQKKQARHGSVTPHSTDNRSLASRSAMTDLGSHHVNSKSSHLWVSTHKVAFGSLHDVSDGLQDKTAVASRA